MEWCAAALLRVVHELSDHSDGRHIGADILEVYYIQIKSVYRELIAIEMFEGVVNEQCLDRVRELLGLIRGMLQDDSGTGGMQNGYCAPIHRQGRPKYVITCNQYVGVHVGEAFHCSANSKYLKSLSENC